MLFNDSFHPFSPLHVLMLMMMGLLIGALIVVARRCTTAKLELAAGCLLLAVWVAGNGWRFWLSHFDLSQNLPLQICDWVALIMPLAFLTGRRSFFVLLYFWGLALSTQAIITPDLSQGPATLWFWWFWGNHTLIMGGVFYIIFVKRFRPGWRDYWLAVLCGTAYFAVAETIDLLFGFNYGYVGQGKPAQPSLIDVLGPWPWRVVFMFLLAWLVTTLLQLPFLRQSKTHRTAAN